MLYAHKIRASGSGGKSWRRYRISPGSAWPPSRACRHRGFQIDFSPSLATVRLVAAPLACPALPSTFDIQPSTEILTATVPHHRSSHLTESKGVSTFLIATKSHLPQFRPPRALPERARRRRNLRYYAGGGN
jgi:hypothetical protein